MKADLLTVVVFSVFGIQSLAQPPMPAFKNKADSLMAEGNVPAAITEYRKLYSVNPKKSGIAYNLACAWSIDNSIIRQFDSCYKYLNIAIALDTTVNALTDPDFLPARDDQRWSAFENRLISMLNIKYHNSIKDTEYAKALWKLSAQDQAFFNEISIAGRKLGMKSSVSSALWRAKLIISRSCQEELDGLIEARGWPKISDVGREAAMAAYLVIQHADSERQRKYLPEVKKRCEENDLPWSRYAMMYDRMLFNENKPQKFGTHTKFNEQTRSEELYPLEDPDNVDKWRNEIGMEPLAEYLGRLNIKYPPAK